MLATEATYRQAALDFVAAYEGSADALGRLNTLYERAFTRDDLRAEIWRRVYAFRQRSSRVPQNYLTPEEAQLLVAQNEGFGSWETLLAAVAAGAPPPGEAYALDPRGGRIGPRRRLSLHQWDELIQVAAERRITAIEGNGLMKDEVLRAISKLEHVTALHLGGSHELSDEGLRHLAGMPQLERLELSEYPGGKLTDRGLAVLRHLPNLREFEMTWQAGVSDEGFAHLRHCEKLERVNLMGSPAGDGAIEALRGKERLVQFSTGRNVTDRGVALLQEFPRFKLAPAGEDGLGRLLLDGPFHDAALGGLAGLAGVGELDLFWHVSELTSAGFAHLAKLPNLMALGCDGKLSDDEAFAHIAAIPRLKRLRAQEAVATDDGFVALSRSQTLEGFWGRVCPNFGSRGFLAFARMPSLRSLGIGCAKVDDAALSALPSFPALRELTPIGFQDDGFRHIGRCENLTRLTCMYCRDTTDGATEHIAGLKNITYYYAGLTQITDRSLAILGRMESLEQVEFYECAHVTDAGLPDLARLPRLREVHLDGLPKVTFEGTRVFPAGVRVYYST